MDLRGYIQTIVLAKSLASEPLYKISEVAMKPPFLQGHECKRAGFLKRQALDSSFMISALTLPSSYWSLWSAVSTT